MKAVWSASVTRRDTSSCSAPRVSASSALKGSSISSILGAMARARAMPTRCFMPPESCAGFFSAAWPSPTFSSACRAASRSFAFGQDGWRQDSAKATFCSAVIQGISAWPWKITARSSEGPVISAPSTITPPSLGASSPARMFSTVVLPQPECPTRQTNSPRFTSNQRSSKIVAPG